MIKKINVCETCVGCHRKKCLWDTRKFVVMDKVRQARAVAKIDQHIFETFSIYQFDLFSSFRG